MKTSIALIGFMGAGKSSTGQILAQKLNKTFVEVDLLIEQKAGKTIPKIFQDEGEIRFRELEIAAIKEIVLHKNQVISCGGGAVLNRINIDRLKQDSDIVWLAVTPATIIARTALNSSLRPVLGGVKEINEVESLLTFRQPFYARAADFAIDTDNLNVVQVVDQIILELKNK